MKDSQNEPDSVAENRAIREIDNLFTRYGSRVMGYLFRLTGNRSEAEDLTQETFLAAFQGQENFQGRSQPLTWLIGIARRRWRDAGRRPPMLTGTNEPEPVSNDYPPERMALAATLSDAMSKLSEAEREVLLLTVVQGLTYREAAGILGEPVGTIKWRAHEAAKQLRKILTAAEERYEARYGNKTETRNTGAKNVPRRAVRPDVSPRERQS